MKVAIMGYYPPPEGGISMHVKRLAGLLDRKNIQCHIYAYGTDDSHDKHITRFSNRRRFAMKYMWAKKEDILHCHIMGWSEKAFYLLAAKWSRKKMLYTFHSYRDGLRTLSGFQKLSFYGVRRFGDGFIAVSLQDQEAMIADGFPKDKVHYIPGFIAPLEESDERETYIHPQVEAFVEKYPTYLTANASNNNHYKGEDLYGLDLCIQMMAQLKLEGIDDVGFVYYLSQITDSGYYKELVELIKTKGLENQFLLVVNGGQYYPVLKEATAFIRSTNTDGDAISIREALYVGCPVVASDCVTRPTGCVLFANRDVKDLVKSVKEILQKDPQVSDGYGKEYGEAVIELYHLLYQVDRGGQYE